MPFRTSLRHLLSAGAAALALTAALPAAAQPQTPSQSTDLVTYTQPWTGLSLQAPPGWQQDTKSDLLSLASPDGAVVITAAALRRQNATLREFADQRFAAVPEFNKPAGQEQALAGGFWRAYEGLWPGDKAPSLYVVGVRESGTAFVSMSIVTDREDFEKNRALYLRILESARTAAR